MSTAILDRYQLAADFEQRANDFEFPVGVWKVAAELAEVREATTPSELVKLTGQSSDQVREALDRLVSKQLVRHNLISWKEFTAAKEEARNAAPTPPEKPAAPSVFKAAPETARQPVPSTSAAAVRPTQSPAETATVPNGHLAAQEGVALRLGTIAPQKTAAATNAWVWQKPDAAQVAASMPVIPSSLPNGEHPDGRLLRPMLAQIENLKGGGVEGQLLVYQVFLRVPYQLLHDEGIKALHLVDERTVIQNPVLHAAIVKAAKEVTGVELS